MPPSRTTKYLQGFLDDESEYTVVGRDISKIRYGSAIKLTFRHQCTPERYHDFECKPNNFTNGRRCPYCSLPAKRLCGDKDCPVCTPRTLFGAKEVLGARAIGYAMDDASALKISRGSHAIIDWTCTKAGCGGVWKSDPHLVLGGIPPTGCTRCADKSRKIARRTPDSFEQSLESELPALAARVPPLVFVSCEKDGDSLRPSDLCRQSNYYATWRCGRCNREWSQTINNVTGNGRSCASCSLEASAQRVKSVLETAIAGGDIDDFEIEWRPKGEAFRFDFLVHGDGERRAIVEVDGRQHFERWDFDASDEGLADRRRRDVAKMAWAIARGIPTVRVPTSAVSFDPRATDWQAVLVNVVLVALVWTPDSDEFPVFLYPGSGEVYAIHMNDLRAELSAPNPV